MYCMQYVMIYFFCLSRFQITIMASTPSLDFVVVNDKSSPIPGEGQEGNSKMAESLMDAQNDLLSNGATVQTQFRNPADGNAEDDILARHESLASIEVLSKPPSQEEVDHGEEEEEEGVEQGDQVEVDSGAESTPQGPSLTGLSSMNSSVELPVEDMVNSQVGLKDTEEEEQPKENVEEVNKQEAEDTSEAREEGAKDEERQDNEEEDEEEDFEQLDQDDVDDDDTKEPANKDEATTDQTDVVVDGEQINAADDEPKEEDQTKEEVAEQEVEDVGPVDDTEIADEDDEDDEDDEEEVEEPKSSGSRKTIFIALFALAALGVGLAVAPVALDINVGKHIVQIRSTIQDALKAVPESEIFKQKPAQPVGKTSTPDPMTTNAEAEEKQRQDEEMEKQRKAEEEAARKRREEEERKAEEERQRKLEEEEREAQKQLILIGLGIAGVALVLIVSVAVICAASKTGAAQAPRKSRAQMAEKPTVKKEGLRSRRDMSKK